MTTIKTKDISTETEIRITLKIALSVVTGILAIFLGFYTLVIVPKIEKAELHQKELLDAQKVLIDNLNETNSELYKQVLQLNQGVGSLQGTVDALNNRFGDLNGLRSTSTNTSGGFSDEEH